jgi:hypothetical protein
MANGQRAEQNNFLLDGVDNNVNIVDYMNGSTYAVAPPPDGLAEFKLETTNYSAEFGRAAGSVLNASVKSGTNQVHGSLWEYFRNTNLNAKDWNSLVIPPYHMNQFGGTLGLPILKNKLFYFGDVQATRISYAATSTFTTPTALMRKGDFSELLNTSLTGQAQPVRLYQPNSGGAAPLTCGGQLNVFCPDQINKVAQNILSLYPQANANGGRTFNNLVENLTTHSNPIQWDQRLDWNATAKDQAYFRYSYQHIVNTLTPPLGPLLDGTVNFAGTEQNYLYENGMLSETHVFSPALVNEFRFGYNWGSFRNLQANYMVDLAGSLGLGGMPFGKGYTYNGGLPAYSVGGITAFGGHGNNPSVEAQNNYQILDNITKIHGSHTLKFGVNFEQIRWQFLQPPASRGAYSFGGNYTSNLNASFTGYGVADFLADQPSGANITSESIINNQLGYYSAYAQDDWRATSKLTVSLGIRYEYLQPYKEQGGREANFEVVQAAPGSGTANYYIPSVSKSTALSPAFLSIAKQNNVNIVYDDNPRLATAQKTGFAPRIGLAYQLTPTTVVRGGFGMFYGNGLIASAGSNANIGENYPFFLRASLPTPSCAPGNCPSLAAQGVTLETGLTNQLKTGLENFISSPVTFGLQRKIDDPFSAAYNVSAQHAFSNNLTATVAFVGNFSHNLMTILGHTGAMALINPANNAITVQPFPLFSSSNLLSFSAKSNYNSMQASVEKRMAKGLNFMASYTWAHALDDTVDPLGGGVPYRNTNLVPIDQEYTNSNYDVRQRLTFNGYYELPFGKGRARLSQSRALDLIAGGWAANVTFTAQTGTPFSIQPNVSAAGGTGTRGAYPIGDVFAPGGTPNFTNNVACAQETRTTKNWYNPCNFANPLAGTLIPRTGDGSQVTGPAVFAYLGTKGNMYYGPGYNRVAMSMFKNFTVWRENYLQFRADVFNLLNHPSWGNPSTTNINANGGTITGPRSFQSNTPDARFFQLSLKLVF